MCHFFWQVSMLFLRPCIQGFFSGFSIISFTKLVNVTWDNKKEFYGKSKLSQFQVIFISGTRSMLPSVQVRLCFPIPFFYFLIIFLHIPFPACRYIASLFISPYPFPEPSYTVLGGASFTTTWFFTIYL